MKKLVFFFLAAVCSLQLAAQGQADAYIKEAQAFLAKKDYKQAVLSLQDAINEINQAIASQTGELLPDEINGLKAEGEAETNSAAMGMMGGGLQITKRYRHPSNPNNDAEVQILANSPMVATLNMYLSNPSVMGAGYKSVRVGTTRAIAKTDIQDNGNGGKVRATEIQIPLGQSLVFVRTNGFASEQDELAFATKLDMDKIRAAVGE